MDTKQVNEDPILPKRVMVKVPALKLEQCLQLHKYARQQMQPTPWVLPDLGDCIRYMCQEAAEALDAEMRATRNHARNNDKGDSMANVAVELADTVMMAAAALMRMGEYAAKQGIDRAKMTSNTLYAVDGLYTDRLVTECGYALQQYDIVSTIGVILNDIPPQNNAMLANGVCSVMAKAVCLMVYLGYDPLGQVKNRLVRIAMKHGEAYKDGYGIAVMDRIEEFYSPFIGDDNDNDNDDKRD